VWNSVTGATDYHFQAATDNLFTSLVADAYLADTTLLQAGLSNNQTYYWRVLARDLTDSSAYSGVFSFTTLLAAPTLTAPSSGAFGQSRTPTLQWNVVGGATDYNVEIADNPSFSPTLYDVNVNTNSYTTPALDYNTLYYWRVNAFNSNNTGNNSSAFNFYTKMETPVLLTPADGAQNQSTTINLTWGAVTGASSYFIQIATDNGFSNI
jgi:hypothetical protein